MHHRVNASSPTSRAKPPAVVGSADKGRGWPLRDLSENKTGRLGV
jgi:hypothetical protein